MSKLFCLFTALIALQSFPARSEILNSGPNGFTVTVALNVSATPAEVYKRLVDDIGTWWSSEHSWSGDSHNMSIRAVPMGCFCEKLPGGGVRHMEVVYADPGKQLTMQGGLGPMLTMAATGNMTIRFSPATNKATRVEATYAVAGYSPAGMNTLAAPVDAVLRLQFGRLKNLIENGDASRDHK